jgi:nitroreductase
MASPKHKWHDFLSLTKSRKTVYDFDNKKVENTDLRDILEAGRWSPSCSNSQPWHFVVIKNKKRLNRLMWGVNYGDFHFPPPLMIAVVLVKKSCVEGSSCFSLTGAPHHDALLCVGMAGLNMTLEAKNLGLGSCILTPNQAVVRKILGVKKEDTVPIIIGFGHEKKGAYQKERSRKAQLEITSYERFGKRSRK